MTLAPRTGECLCGAVRLDLSRLRAEIHACHCENCRRQTGSCTMSVMVPHDAIKVRGAEYVTTFASSAWATRSFCNRCGSSLWYRLTKPDPATADYYISAGLLDDLSGLRLTQEIYIDRKPEGWAFAGDAEKLTGAEFEALVAAKPGG